jgi:hypothetical protein
VNLPAGITTISGQTGQSRKIAPGARAGRGGDIGKGLCSAIAGALPPLDAPTLEIDTNRSKQIRVRFIASSPLQMISLFIAPLRA